MKKQIAPKCIAVFLAMLMLYSLLPFQASAETPEALYEYAIRKDYENGDFATLTQYKGNETDLVLPDTIGGYPVREIDSHFIENPDTCGIKTITLPAQLERILMGGLTGIKTLEAVYMEEPNAHYRTEDGVLFGYEDSIIYLELYPSAKTTKDYTVPEGVNFIGGNAFAYNTHLQSIQMPRSLVEVVWYAFRDCTALERVTFSTPNTPDNWLYINNNVFWGCTALKEIRLPSCRCSVGFKTFPQNDGLTVYGTISPEVEAWLQTTNAKFINTKIYFGSMYSLADQRIVCTYDGTSLRTVLEVLEHEVYESNNEKTITVLDKDGNVITDYDRPAQAGIRFQVYSVTFNYTDTYRIFENRRGDVNADGKVSAVDARYALQTASGTRTLWDDVDKEFADANKDGQITAVDARYILQTAAGVRELESVY